MQNVEYSKFYTMYELAFEKLKIHKEMLDPRPSSEWYT